MNGRGRRVAPALLILVSSAAPGVFEKVAGAQGASPPAPAHVALPSAAMNELDHLVATLDREEKSLKAELGDLGPKLDVTRKRMVARSRAYYREIRAGFLPAGAGFDALVDHAARVERIRRAIERDVGAEGALLRRGADIDARLTKLRAERAPLDVQRDAMNRARLALQEQEERRAAFARAFETSVRPDASMAVYGADTGPLEGDARGGFAAKKGRLAFPIAGRAEVRRFRRDGVGSAMEFAAAAGTAVRSVAAGRVVFSDRHEDYGLTVILDHGDRYYTVYAHLGSRDVAVGDKIGSGQRLGGVGAEPGSRLHFELRKGASAIDPGPWLGI